MPGPPEAPTLPVPDKEDSEHHFKKSLITDHVDK